MKNAEPDIDTSTRRLTQAERRDRSERELIAAAIKVVADQGVAAATFEVIAGEAGFSRGLVTQRFGSKEGLTRSLIAHLHGELKLAHVIQKALVPTEFPHISGFEFSTKFVPSSISGGDYFDIFEHQDKMKFGILLADSSGYQFSALFLSTLIQFSSRMVRISEKTVYPSVDETEK